MLLYVLFILVLVAGGAEKAACRLTGMATDRVCRSDCIGQLFGISPRCKQNITPECRSKQMSTDGDEQPCSLANASRVFSCYREFAYRLAGGEVLNVSTLGEYCSSSPGRTDGNHCVGNFTSGCPVSVTNSPRSSSVDLSNWHPVMARAMNYVCSNKEVIANNRECVENSRAQVRECFTNAVQVVFSQYRQRLSRMTQEEIRQMTSSVGVQVESCTVRVLSQECNEDLANVVGNYLHAFFSYINYT